MSKPLRVLLVEDSEDDAILLAHELRRGGFDVTSRRVDTAAALAAALASGPWDVILCDHSMPALNSTTALKMVRAAEPDTPFVIVSGSIGEEVAVQSMRAGAQDYLLKGNLARLTPVVERELREAVERQERRKAEQSLLAQAEEMRIGHAIQAHLFPAAPPALPGFDIAGASFPAAATGGDYFDYVPLTDGGLGIIVGDVSGHGIGPALIMADTRACLRALACSFSNAGDILLRANRLLRDDLENDRYITLVFAMLPPGGCTVRYVNAGHPAGYVLDTTGATRATLPATMPALGLLPLDQPPPTAEVPFAPGDLLLLLTDGITEAATADGEEFGLDRTLAVVRDHRTAPAAAIVQALADAVRAFTLNQPQSDDLTVVVVKALP